MATYSKVCSNVGSFTFGDRFTLYVVLTNRDGNPSTNQSVVDYNVYFQNTSGGGTFTSRTRLYFALNGGVIKDTTSEITGPRNGSVTVASGSTTIDHNNDGTKSISYHALVQSATFGINGEISGTFTLNTIPRASSVSGGSGNIGGKTTISVSRASTSFTHTLRYAFGSLSGTIATGVGDSYTWTIPTSFYAQIPNDKRGTGTIYCDTYSGSTLVGTKPTSFTATADKETCKPTVSATIKDTNSTTIALTGDANKLIKYKSTAQLVITSTPKNSAKIKSVTVNGTNVGTATSITLNYANVSTDSFAIIATDTREYPSSTVNISPNYVNYVPLTLSATIFRPQPTGTEIQMSYSGNYFNGSFGSVANTLSITWKYRVQGASSWTNGGTITPTLSGNTISSKTISLGTSYDYQTAYDFQITAVDKLTTNTQTIAVSVGMPVFYWGKDFFNIIGKIKSRLNLHTNAGLYWKEGAYGDQFEIIPDFGNDNDNNKLKIRGAVGAINTSPSLYDLFYITGMSGNAWFKGYINSPAVRSKLESTNARISNANIGHTYENGRAHVQLLLATSTMTSNKPIKDGYILHFSWDNDGQYNAQFFIGNGVGIDSGKVQVRGCTDGTWSSWETLDRMKVLYDNSSGTTGTVTLSETAANFNYLEIFYRNSYSFHTSTRIANPNGKCAELEVTHVHGSSSKTVTIESRNVDINGTSLTTGTKDSYGKWWSAGNNLEIVNNIYIYKVVGYR